QRPGGEVMAQDASAGSWPPVAGPGQRDLQGFDDEPGLAPGINAETVHAGRRVQQVRLGHSLKVAGNPGPYRGHLRGGVVTGAVRYLIEDADRAGAVARGQSDAGQAERGADVAVVLAPEPFIEAGRGVAVVLG